MNIEGQGWWCGPGCNWTIFFEVCIPHARAASPPTTPAGDGFMWQQIPGAEGLLLVLSAVHGSADNLGSCFTVFPVLAKLCVTNLKKVPCDAYGNSLLVGKEVGSCCHIIGI